jgi:alkyl hydroperoxide reductase subunit AhpF
MIQYGTPGGYEFRSFLAGIIAASAGYGESIDDASRQMIDALPASLHMQIFTSPGCPHCPKMAGLGFELAATSERFWVDAIDVTQFPELAQQYGVRGIPLTVVNDSFEMVGAMPAQPFLKKLLRENIPPPRAAPP